MKLEFDYKQACTWKCSKSIAILAVARGVWLWFVTIANENTRGTDQIIVNLNLYYFYNQIIDIGDIYSFLQFRRSCTKRTVD